MKVWELMAQLSKLPAGADVLVQINSKQIPGSKSGWFVSVSDYIHDNSPDEPAAVIRVCEDIVTEIEKWKESI